MSSLNGFKRNENAAGCPLLSAFFAERVGFDSLFLPRFSPETSVRARRKRLARNEHGKFESCESRAVKRLKQNSSLRRRPGVPGAALRVAGLSLRAAKPSALKMMIEKTTANVGHSAPWDLAKTNRVIIDPS
jgi:hypothetical protein